ncbi:Di-copper centre-containing protein [Aspergillus heteromorphus CBS 117.55]|uniref:tyrosinase n=1 Tax=Aspergillus heteromorphus CBS 117.55 TaxID=1448321 RepID=A0A317WUV6_9EURO|nr:Di-copper centre-containing protein [Aspergillus heteromorphus CBS 117.55]PWY89865.1 Di-copper centre-containing protein [Aspergillus heteromorphus CBS 117.55]
MAPKLETRPKPKPKPQQKADVLSNPVGGIPVDPGQPIPKRRDIREWSQSTKIEDQIQKSLYIRALKELQERDNLNDPFSFFQLGTIHWKPFVAWNSDPKYNKDAGGYCAHATYAFPTWHRVYVIVYEKALYDVMSSIVAGIQDEPGVDIQAWKDAAKLWRHPYWDWADPKVDPMDIVPQLVRDARVSVLLPGSTTDYETIHPNPLHKFTNKVWVDGHLNPVKPGQGQLVKLAMNDDRMGDYKLELVNEDGPAGIKDIFNECYGTSRHGDPSSPEWVNGVENDDLVGQTFKDNAYIPGIPDENFTDATVATNLYRLLLPTKDQSYESFSSTLNYNPDTNPGDYLSLESIHNNIHFRTGSGGGSNSNGHMSLPEVAGFDPIFFLHHSNVDRILAMWQVLNPGKWIQASYDDVQVTGPNTLGDPLYPFYKDTLQTAWTSADVQDWHTLGYTYAECDLGSDGLKTFIESTYNVTKNLQHAAGKVLGVGRNGHYDYIVNVDYDRYALDGHSYAIHLYLEDAAGKKWNLDDVYTFSAPLEEAGSVSCGNCKSQKDAGLLSRAQVPITVQLFTLLTEQSLGYASGLPANSQPSIEPGVVEELLKDQLQWSVVSYEGNEYDPGDMPGLKVTVQHAIARIPQGTEDSPAPLSLTMEKYQPLWSATHGKAAGARDPTLI